MNIAERYDSGGKIYSRLHAGDKVVVIGKRLPHIIAAKEGDVLSVLDIHPCKEAVIACRCGNMFDKCPSNNIYARSFNPETKATVALCLYDIRRYAE